METTLAVGKTTTVRLPEERNRSDELRDIAAYLQGEQHARQIPCRACTITSHPALMDICEAPPQL